jgi:hypothetical protein
VNRWVYDPLQGGPVVDGVKLFFKQDLALQGWQACSRVNGLGADSIGVSVTYSYKLQTALGVLMNVANFGMRDHTVMQLNPTGK